MERLLVPDQHRELYANAVPQFVRIAQGYMKARPDPAVELDDLLQEGLILLHGLTTHYKGRVVRDLLAYAVTGYVRLLAKIYGRAGARKRNPADGELIRDGGETVAAAMDRYGYRNVATQVFIAELESLLTAFDIRVLNELMVADVCAGELIEAIDGGRPARPTITTMARAFGVHPDTVRQSIKRIRRVVADEYGRRN